MFGTIPPFYSLGGGGGFGITGSPSAGWVFNKTAETGAAEVVATFGVSDALISSGNYLRIANSLSTDSRFAPEIIGSCGNSNLTALQLTAQGTTDSSGSLMAFNARIGASTTVVTRPLYSFRNNGTETLSLLPLNSGANSALNWGLQTGGAPTFTTRSAGTRIILANTLDASNVDYAIGQLPFTTWYSVAQATSSFEHRFYAGTSPIARLRGDGLLITTGGRVKKVRIALTSPVTIAVTDDIVVVDLTTPGAVTINYPASPEAGREYTVIDGKGDAAANNHTHTPAAGTINNAATAVVATSNYRRTAAYDGTKWNLG